jgi:hypothetical protein
MCERSVFCLVGRFVGGFKTRSEFVLRSRVGIDLELTSNTKLDAVTGFVTGKGFIKGSGTYPYKAIDPDSLQVFD